VQADIAAIVEVAHAAGAIVKVIFENAYLTGRRKDPGLPPERGGRPPTFVKTFDRLRAGRRHARGPPLMRANTSPHIQVKAAGGRSNVDALLAVRELGVTRMAHRDRDHHPGLPRPEGRGARLPVPRPVRWVVLMDTAAVGAVVPELVLPVDHWTGALGSRGDRYRESRPLDETELGRNW